MKEQITHCQICARPIKAKTGYIAHHGYQRPGDGWQTASCYGARNLPYEQSCALIPPVILNIKEWVTNRKVWLTDFEATPPAELTTITYGSYDKAKIVARPKDYDPERRCYAYFEDDRKYDNTYKTTIHRTKQAIKAAETQLIFLQERLEHWVAPQN